MWQRFNDACVMGFAVFGSVTLAHIASKAPGSVLEAATLPALTMAFLAALGFFQRDEECCEEPCEDC
jgi:hypothetical protein